ncbi:MAG: hypothetical protein V2I33_24145, partial [Kangiellaceae bacterium]|nr:hypothetical protein [Kangiellaceae bacterium]
IVHGVGVRHVGTYAALDLFGKFPGVILVAELLCSSVELIDRVIDIWLSSEMWSHIFVSVFKSEE